MPLVFSVIIAWIVAAYLFTNMQKKEVTRSLILYFIYSILSVSTIEIVSMNLHLVDISQDKVKFLSFLIYRNIIMPLLLLIFINLFYRATIYRKFITIVILLILDALLEFSELEFGFYSYIKWNFGLTMLLISFFVLISLLIGKCINNVQMRSGQI